MLFLNSLIPFIGNLLLPVLILLYLYYTFTNDLEGLSDFEVFHVLIIVKIISKFK